MVKTTLETFIKKYYLQGTVESVKWVVDKTAKILKTSAITDDKNVMMHITLKEFEDIPDAEIGIYDTAKLLKMLGVLGDDITVDLNKSDSTITGMTFSDTNMDVQYVAADLSVIPNVPNLKKLPEFNVEINLNAEFIAKFIAAKNALAEVNTFTFLMDKKNVLNLVIGQSLINTNRIKLNVQAVDGKNKVNKEINFNAAYFKEILIANKEADAGVLKVSDAGLAMVEFTQGNYSVVYYMVEVKTA